MHNRDMIWTNKEGERIKIKDINSSHLTNIIPFIKKHKDAFDLKYGKKQVKYMLKNIKQEIRFRKLNRIKTINEEDKLF